MTDVKHVDNTDTAPSALPADSSPSDNNYTIPPTDLVDTTTINDEHSPDVPAPHSCDTIDPASLIDALDEESFPSNTHTKSTSHLDEILRDENLLFDNCKFLDLLQDTGDNSLSSIIKLDRS